MQTLKKLLFLLSSNERRNAVLLLMMILIMALLDMIGVASVLPFIAVLTNSSLIETNLVLNWMFKSSKMLEIPINKGAFKIHPKYRAQRVESRKYKALP